MPSGEGSFSTSVSTTSRPSSLQCAFAFMTMSDTSVIGGLRAPMTNFSDLVIEYLPPAVATMAPLAHALMRMAARHGAICWMSVFTLTFCSRFSGMGLAYLAELISLDMKSY